MKEESIICPKCQETNPPHTVVCKYCFHRIDKDEAVQPSKISAHDMEMRIAKKAKLHQSIYRVYFIILMILYIYQGWLRFIATSLNTNGLVKYIGILIYLIILYFSYNHPKILFFLDSGNIWYDNPEPSDEYYVLNKFLCIVMPLIMVIYWYLR